MPVESGGVAGGLRHPRLKAPPGTCDTHMHIIYPESRFPFAPGKDGSFPEFGVDEYRKVARALGIERCVVAQTPPYETDNRNVMAAVSDIGMPARATVTVGSAIGDDELQSLQKAGAIGANFFMLPGGCLAWPDLPVVAAKVAPFGWHVQVQLDGRELDRREQVLRDLPTPVVIDHIGKFLGPADLDHRGFKALLRLVDTGKVYVKLSAPGESSIDEPPYMKDAGARAAALIEAAPERMLWASNWPHLGDPEMASKPDNATYLDCLLAWTDDEAVRRTILVDNPARVYGFED